MASPNTSPIYSRLPVLGFGTIATANTAKDGTGTVVLVWTAASEVGGRIDKVKVRPLGTNVATVLRLFINNGSTNATATNNVLYYEKTIPASTLSEVAEQTDIEVSLNLPLPPGYRVYATIGTTVAAGLHLTGVGGSY
jgi:hypothetical protein